METPVLARLVTFFLSFYFVLCFRSRTIAAEELQYGGYVYKQFQNPERDRFLYGHFPANFSWGVATSAHQVEGAWVKHGKGRSIWDIFTHKRKHIFGEENGDIACGSYDNVKLDVALLRKLGVKHYKFSLSWVRILPEGTTNRISQQGIEYYHRLIETLLKVNIEPIVTLHHWDLPQVFQDMGGWSNEHVITYFNDYAEICFAEFGAKVKKWITFDQPSSFAIHGHDTGILAPGLKHQGTTVYRVAHNMIKAHAMAWHTYDKKYRSIQHGEVGISLLANWGISVTERIADLESADMYMQFTLGWFAHPLFVNGDYPYSLKAQVLMKSREQHLTSSRLPKFTEKEKVLIQGSVDFLGIEYFTSYYVDARRSKYLLPASHRKDQDSEIWASRKWPTTGAPEYRVAPWGIREVLKWVKGEYNNPPIYITGNGMAENVPSDDKKSVKLMDIWRIQFLKAHIDEVLKAQKLDRVDVRGYTVWSLMDSFEWMHMYSVRYGLFYVNLTDPVRTRMPRASAEKYAQIIQTNGFVKPSRRDVTKQQIAPEVVNASMPLQTNRGPWTKEDDTQAGDRSASQLVTVSVPGVERIHPRPPIPNITETVSPHSPRQGFWEKKEADAPKYDLLKVEKSPESQEAPVLGHQPIKNVLPNFPKPNKYDGRPAPKPQSTFWNKPVDTLSEMQHARPSSTMQNVRPVVNSMPPISQNVQLRKQNIQSPVDNIRLPIQNVQQPLVQNVLPQMEEVRPLTKVDLSKPVDVRTPYVPGGQWPDRAQDVPKTRFVDTKSPQSAESPKPVYWGKPPSLSAMEHESKPLFVDTPRLTIGRPPIRNVQVKAENVQVGISKWDANKRRMDRTSL
ncbi:cytosolic beta-glucosidase-like [Saccoglossus kowalevskii]